MRQSCFVMTMRGVIVSDKDKAMKKARAKAIRAAKLADRGHDLMSIAEMCSIPTGSVTKRIVLGKRLIEAGIK